MTKGSPEAIWLVIILKHDLSSVSVVPLASMVGYTYSRITLTPRLLLRFSFPKPVSGV